MNPLSFYMVFLSIPNWEISFKDAARQPFYLVNSSNIIDGRIVHGRFPSSNTFHKTLKRMSREPKYYEFTDILQTLYISEDDSELGKMTTKMNIVNFLFFEYNDIIFNDVEKDQFTKIMEYMQPHYDQILIDLCKCIIYYLKSDDKMHWIESFNQTYNNHTRNVMSHIHNFMNKN